LPQTKDGSRASARLAATQSQSLADWQSVIESSVALSAVQPLSLWQRSSMRYRASLVWWNSTVSTLFMSVGGACILR